MTFNPWLSTERATVVRLYRAGVSAAAIAAQLDPPRSKNAVAQFVSRLAASDPTMRRYGPRAPHVVPARLPPPVAAVTRRCLRCREPFQSAHVGNRLCRVCGQWASAQ